MIDPNEIPASPIERATMLEGILVSTATGGGGDNNIYEHLRREFMADPNIRDLLPSFVRTYRNLSSFWPFIKKEAPTYDQRRQFINDAFTPLMDHLDGRHSAPGDKPTSEVLSSFDVEGVHVVWMKALHRRQSDPEGAITVARTLLETVTKTILDELGEMYSDKDDLPKLYGKVAERLNIAPSQHTLEPIKAILGGAMNLVNGIGTLRNRLSDAHGRGGKPVRPLPRHANLAVNCGGALATFLVETYLEQKLKP